jgi:hypothetical protein
VAAPRHPMTANDLEELKVAARYHRERLALYRARVYGGSLTSDARLRELERASDFAEQRLRRARRVATDKEL